MYNNLSLKAGIWNVIELCIYSAWDELLGWVCPAYYFFWEVI